MHRIVDQVRREFGIALVDVAPVTGGADAAATVWRATADDGRDYAVKLSSRNTDVGLLVASELAAAGIPGIAAPLPDLAGRPSTCCDGVRLSLFEWILGPRGSEVEMTNEHWRRFGALLGHVHRAQLPTALESRLRRVGFDNPAIDLARHIRDGFAAFDDVSRQMVQAWDAAGPSIAELIVRSERLAAAARACPAPDVICHGDAHTINLIIGAGGQPFLLDWDEVSIAPAERDLMFVIGGGIFTDNPITDEQQAAFVAGYGPLDVDPTRLDYYYCARALEDVTEFAKEIFDRSAKRESREFALSCVLDLLSPTGPVNVALSRTS